MDEDEVVGLAGRKQGQTRGSKGVIPRLVPTRPNRPAASVPVQNSLLEPRNFAGVSSQGGATGGPEKAPSRRGQGGRLRETAFRK